MPNSTKLVPGLSDLRFTSEQKTNVLDIFAEKSFPTKIDLTKSPEPENLEVLENVLGSVGLWPLPVSGGSEARKSWKRTNVETTPRAQHNAAKKRSRSRLICFQCSCGIDSAQRKDYKGKRRRVTKYKYTGCLAHCRISVTIAEDGEKDVEGQIRWFQGYFDHNHEPVDLDAKLEISDTNFNGVPDDTEAPSKTVTKSESSWTPSPKYSEGVIEPTIQTGPQRLRNACEFALSEYRELSRFVQAFPERTEGTQLAKMVEIYKEVMEKLQSHEGWAQPLSNQIIGSRQKNGRTAMTAGILPVEREPKQRR